MEKNTVKRITKAMQFTYIKKMLEGEQNILDVNGKPYMVDDALKFIDNEMALLLKKNSGDSKKPTKTQKENKELAKEIIAYLVTQDSGVTATEIMSACGLSSNQKAVALLKPLIDSGEVIKLVVKGKSLFKLADN